MKKKHSPELDDDLRPEHGPEFFENMQPNRFAGMDLKFKGRPPGYLDEDVSEVFQSSEAVNTVLRSAIRAMRTAAPKPCQSMVAKKRRAS
jgi:hypothetical protein